jgi:hypothetical protein
MTALAARGQAAKDNSPARPHPVSSCCSPHGKDKKNSSTIFGSARLKVTAEESEFCSAFSIPAWLAVAPSMHNTARKPTAAKAN